MKIVMLSNFYNHHQKPLADQLKKNADYTFIATEPIEKERLALGYRDMNMCSEVIRAYENNEEYKKSLDIINNADVVLFGQAPWDMIKDRIKAKKLVFEYSERIKKPAITPNYSKYKSIIISLRRKFLYGTKNQYLLSAGAYVLSDFKEAKMYNKAFKWGYFPEFIEYDIERIIDYKKNNKIKLLWAGRFIEWKYPIFVIKIANILKQNCYNFSIDMIGNGNLFAEIQREIEKNNLQGYINLLGALNPEEVREKMLHSNIFMFTSDLNEGWGAVLNEAMNSACAVVANKMIGSVPFLLKDNQNGLIYDDNFDDFAKCILKVVDNIELCNRLGENAYETIKNVWSPKIAAENLIKLSNQLINKKTVDYDFGDGPCSKDNGLK